MFKDPLKYYTEIPSVITYSLLKVTSQHLCLYILCVENLSPSLPVKIFFPGPRIIFKVVNLIPFYHMK